METFAAEDWDDVFDVNLRVEARRFGVRASVLCPGVVPIEPQAFARGAVDGVVRDQAVIVVPGWFKALHARVRKELV